MLTIYSSSHVNYSSIKWSKKNTSAWGVAVCEKRRTEKGEELCQYVSERGYDSRMVSGSHGEDVYQAGNMAEDGVEWTTRKTRANIVTG